MNDKTSTLASRFGKVARIGAVASLAVAGLVGVTAAQARDNVSFSLGIGVPGVAVGVSNAPYYSPAPVYYAPQPVYVQPAPVYYNPPPVYYRPAPVYYQPRPVYYGPYYGPRGHGHGPHGHGRR